MNAFLDRSWPNEAGKIAPMSIELTDSEISSFLWTIYTNFWQAFLIWIVPAPALLSELERLYESCGMRTRGLSAFPALKPPAGPPKLDFTHGADDFSKILPKIELQITNFDARGKPSTVFPRGRLVETVSYFRMSVSHCQHNAFADTRPLT